MGLGEYITNWVDDVCNLNVLKMFNMRKNFNRASPLAWLFFFGLLSVIVGWAVKQARILLWIGLVIIFIYLLYFILWYLNG